MSMSKQTFYIRQIKRLWASIWLFPVLLLLPLIVLTITGISGSSIGIYHQLFYGEEADSSLLLNSPQTIRSDEWMVGTQMAIAQQKNHYNKINQNIGNGEDVSVILDAPHRDWSGLFKPHNFAFFILPFDNAFAFKWWIMAYLLIVSCYLFAVYFLPKQRLFAALLALSLFFSPFIQWWYQYVTLAPIFYGLFGALLFAKILNEANFKKRLALGALLAYVATCFAFILYPPFQIPCAIAIAAFAVGYTLEKYNALKHRDLVQRLSVVGVALIIAAGFSLGFIMTRSETIHTIQNTAYPGKRIEASGGYDVAHFLSGSLNSQLQYSEKSSYYRIPGSNQSLNQSESSNFIFIWPFLLVASLLVIANDYRKDKKLRPDTYCLLLINAALLLLTIRLFLPLPELFGKLTLLESIPHKRTILGFGLLQFIQIVLLVRLIMNRKLTKRLVFLTVSGSFAALSAVNVYLAYKSPGYIGYPKAVLIAGLLAVFIYALLRLRLVIAASLILALSLYMTYQIHPLYAGTKVLNSSEIISRIETLSEESPEKRWVIETGLFENFAIMAGAKSLSGVYYYPQNELWKSISTSKKDEKVYNRFSHVTVSFDRNIDTNIKTRLVPIADDSFKVETEACSNYISEMNVGYLVTNTTLDYSASCFTLVDTVRYPKTTFFIYRAN